MQRLLNKKILITNDDGYGSVGIELLEEAVKGLQLDPFVIAPLHERSGTSASTRYLDPMQLFRMDETHYKLDANPVDCVKVGRNLLMDKNLDLVLSGVNIGHNAGYSIFYSGTMGAVFEAYIKGVDGIGFSMFGNYKVKLRDSIIKIIKLFISDYYLKYGGTYSVNIPAIDFDRFKGFKVIPHSKSYYDENYEIIKTSSETKFVYIKSDDYLESDYPISELEYLKKGYCVITPIKLDINDYENGVYKI